MVILKFIHLHSDANFVVSAVGNDAGGNDKVSYMVIAGGGGGAGKQVNQCWRCRWRCWWF